MNEKAAQENMAVVERLPLWRAGRLERFYCETIRKVSLKQKKLPFSHSFTLAEHYELIKSPVGQNKAG